MRPICSKPVQATSLIESFIGSDDGDVLITDPVANFYTRVGLIAMSDKAEVCTRGKH